MNCACHGGKLGTSARVGHVLSHGRHARHGAIPQPFHRRGVRRSEACLRLSQREPVPACNAQHGSGVRLRIVKYPLADCVAFRFGLGHIRQYPSGRFDR
jgi:hypothetical protein